MLRFCVVLVVCVGVEAEAEDVPRLCVESEDKTLTAAETDDAPYFSVITKPSGSKVLATVVVMIPAMTFSAVTVPIDAI